MNRKSFSCVLAALFIALFALAPFFSVLAKKAFSLSPMFERILVEPGRVFMGSFEISNPADSDEDFHYAITVSPYSVTRMNGSDDDYSGADYESRSDMNMIVDWTEIENPNGVLRPNEQRTIHYTVNVPSNAPGGGQYMALMIGEDPAFRDDNKSGINEIMQMAHVVYAEVPGVTIKKGSIIANELPSFITSGNLTTSATVRNDGNIHADAEFILQIWPLFSEEELYTNEENPNTVLVMPDSQRYYTHTYNLPSVGIFRAKQTVRIFGEESVVEKTIIVCPIWLLFIILFVIILFVIWIFTRTKLKKSSKKAEN